MTEKEHPSAIQPNQRQNFQSLPEEEINLMDILEVLLKNKVLILAIASISTLLSILYTRTITPTYETSITVLEPQETFLMGFPENSKEKFPGGAQKKQDGSEDKNNLTPFTQFLSIIKSFSHKKDVFEQGDFLNKFYESSNNTSDNTILRLHNSMRISKVSGDLPDMEKQVHIKISGLGRPKILSEYLTKLVDSAKEKTAENIRESIRTVINAETNNLSAEISKLRLVKEEELKKEIFRLTEALEIASNLGIQNNNLDKLSNQDFQIGVQQPVLEDHLEHTTSSIRIVNNSLPLWFLYGKKALQQELKKLKKRIKEEPVLGVAERESELNWYKTIDPSSLNIKVVTISQPSIPPTSPVKSKNRMYIVTGMIAGLILGIALAFIRNLMDHLKQRQKAIASTKK